MTTPEELEESAQAAMELLTEEAKRIGCHPLRLKKLALWNLVADLEGAPLDEAREIVGIEEGKVSS